MVEAPYVRSTYALVLAAACATLVAAGVGLDILLRVTVIHDTVLYVDQQLAEVFGPPAAAALVAALIYQAGLQRIARWTAFAAALYFTLADLELFLGLGGSALLFVPSVIFAWLTWAALRGGEHRPLRNRNPT
jgi:hypothetical protein